MLNKQVYCTVCISPMFVLNKSTACSNVIYVKFQVQFRHQCLSQPFIFGERATVLFVNLNMNVMNSSVSALYIYIRDQVI